MEGHSQSTYTEKITSSFPEFRLLCIRYTTPAIKSFTLQIQEIGGDTAVVTGRIKVSASRSNNCFNSNCLRNGIDAQLLSVIMQNILSIQGYFLDVYKITLYSYSL